MENITVGQIGVGLTFIVGLISSILYLKNQLKNWVSEALKDQLEGLSEKIDEVDMNATKNFLVARLSDIEQDNPMNEIEAERFWEQYEHYHSIGGNSYIDQKVEKLKQKGKL